MLGIAFICHFSLFLYHGKINSSSKCVVHMTAFFEAFHFVRLTSLIHVSKSLGLENGKEKNKTLSLASDLHPGLQPYITHMFASATN